MLRRVWSTGRWATPPGSGRRRSSSSPWTTSNSRSRFLSYSYYLFLKLTRTLFFLFHYRNSDWKTLVIISRGDAIISHRGKTPIHQNSEMTTPSPSIVNSIPFFILFHIIMFFVSCAASSLGDSLRLLLTSVTLYDIA